MSKTRDIIYLFNEVEDSVNYSMGIEFREFVACLPRDINNLLLLASEYNGEDFHNGLRLEFVRHEHLEEIINDNVYRYGDFCWVDFESVESLDKLEQQEIAELLYLGHMMKPLGSPFFEKLNNRYVYLAHDDGWFNKLYMKETKAYADVIANLIPLKLQILATKKVSPLSGEISRYLFDLCEKGLLIDFNKVIITTKNIQIPYYVIGKILDIDKMNNNLDEIIENAEHRAFLIYGINGWKIQKLKI